MKWAPFWPEGIEESWTSTLRTALRYSRWSKKVLDNNAIPHTIFSLKQVRTSHKAGAMSLTFLGQVSPISIIFLLLAMPRERVSTMRAWLKTRKTKIRSNKTKIIWKAIKTSRLRILVVSLVSIILKKLLTLKYRPYRYNVGLNCQTVLTKIAQNKNRLYAKNK